MVIFIVSFLVSLVPTLVLYLWMRKALCRDDAGCRRLYDRSFRGGLLCSFPVIGASAVLNAALLLTGLAERNPLLYQALYTFIVLALAEEAVKFITFRRRLKKTEVPLSWLDVAAAATLVGLGFGTVENLVLSIGSGVVTMLIRAFTIAHGGYGFVVGYFYGKGVKTGKPFWKIFGLVLIWLIHGLYDFSLSKEFDALNDNLVVVPVTIAFLDLVLAVVLVVFFARARKRELYTEPLFPAPAVEGTD